LEGYRAGRFAEGSVIVFDLLAAQEGGNAIVEGPRKVVGVMHKDSTRFASTGGCHTSPKGRDFVFGSMRK
jgi:hypothetical protein